MSFQGFHYILLRLFRCSEELEVFWANFRFGAINRFWLFR